jgi:hypothetical protein
VITTAGRDLDRRTGVFGPLVVLGSLFGYLFAVVWAMESSSYNVWAGLAVLPALVALSLPIVRRLAAKEADPVIARLLMIAVLLKLGGAIARFAVSYDVYGGAGDGGLYASAGAQLAPYFRAGQWVDVGHVTGTNFINILTGIVFVVTGPTQLGGFLVFSWFGFWGLYLFYRAFVLACPDGDHRLYARLVFLLPSLIYWPSSIGKEAWMTLTLGLAAYAAARIFRRRPGGYPLLALAVIGAGVVRPHVTLAVLVGIVAGSLLHRRSGGAFAGIAGKALAVAAFAAATVITVPHLESFLNVDRLDAQTVTGVLDRTERLSAKNGATFDAPRPTTVLEFPAAAVSVLFRPFIWEAHNPQAFASSLEGCFLALLILRRRRSLARVRSAMRSSGYVGFAVAYSCLFVLLLSAFGNFGIVARERVQVFPMLLVLVALAPTATVKPAMPLRTSHVVIGG